MIGAFYQGDAYGMIIVLLQDAENATLSKMHAPCPLAMKVGIIGALYQGDAYIMIIVLLQDAENATLPKTHAPCLLAM